MLNSTKTETVQAQQIAAAVVDPANTPSDLEKQIEAILTKRRTAAVEAAQPKEPDWATLTEKDTYSPAIYIPVIDHELPDYMNMMLKDPEYVAVWASKDQRRIGQLLAEGYEILKPEHVHPQFKLPLLFDSEGRYLYVDVICLRAHKRLIYGKRRKAFDVSQRQLRNTHRPPSVREEGTFNLTEVPSLGKDMSYYEPMV